MSEKNLVLSIELIALALSENDGYEYYHIDDELRELAKDASDVQTENAKLRELVRILAHCAAGHGCDICQINGGEGLINILDMCESVHDRMRELGIEVK